MSVPSCVGDLGGHELALENLSATVHVAPRSRPYLQCADQLDGCTRAEEGQTVRVWSSMKDSFLGAEITV